MKKLIIITAGIFILYSCSKKITTTASSPNTNAVVSKPAEEIVSNPAVQPTTKVQPVDATGKANHPAIAPATANNAKPLPVVAEPKEPGQVVLGGETYRVKCSKCHELKDPKDYTEAKWVKLVDWMAPRAKLDATEKDNIIAYVSFHAKK